MDSSAFPVLLKQVQVVLTVEPHPYLSTGHGEVKLQLLLAILPSLLFALDYNVRFVLQFFGG